MVVPRNENVIDRAWWSRHHLQCVILPEHVGLAINAWIHYLYCGRMFQLIEDLRACIAKLNVSGLGPMLDNQHNSLDCIVHVTMHDQVPFENYPPTWRNAPTSSRQAVSLGPKNWKGTLRSVWCMDKQGVPHSQAHRLNGTRVTPVIG